MYAIAKITGIKMCNAYRQQYGCNFISCMPCNLYGPNDNFNLETSHLLPALFRKFYEAVKNNKKEVIVWGTGKPLREFLYVDDLAKATLFLMQNYNKELHINIGYGKDHEINEIIKTIAEIVDFKGNIIHDTTKPDGTFRKLMDSSKINKLGWKPSISLKQGIKKLYDWYKENEKFIRQ